ncbi:MAG: hypothetical protein EA350_12710 [Gemmatimonadales bacterium]|nr:MAG: hypothetical protein EA350_12710 [Gemmatimonadales bacterium]
MRTLYEQYCRSEARELLGLLSREGRRSLMRAESESGRPLSVEALHDAARRLLPLPPYEAWVPSYLANRRAYLERLGIPAVPARTAPVTIAIRRVGDRWWAHLNVRRVEGQGEWRGFVAFHEDADAQHAGRAGSPGPGAPVGRQTAEIFRGPDPELLRSRFLEFGEAAMEGFFRSASD